METQLSKSADVELLTDETAAVSRRAIYREAEGLEDSIYTEKLIGDALEKWKLEIAKEDEADSDKD